MKKLIALLLIVNVVFITNVFSQEKKVSEEKQVKVLITTDYGNMTVVLYNETPQHRDNFVKLVNEGWYEGSPFHRIIKNFMIQGGQNADGRRDPGYTIPSEFVAELYHKKGALAAARLDDDINPQKASSGSQFYIVQNNGGTPHLDGSYTVFGEVIDGFDVIDKIASVKTGQANKPVASVTMSMKIVE